MEGNAQNNSPASPDEVQGPAPASDSTVLPANGDSHVQTPQSPGVFSWTSGSEVDGELLDDVSGKFFFNAKYKKPSDFTNSAEKKHKNAPSSSSMISPIVAASMTSSPFTTAFSAIKDTLPINDQSFISGTASDSKDVKVPWSIQHPFTFPSFGTSPINVESPSETASDSTNVKVPWSIRHPFAFPSFGTSPINEESPSETASDSTNVKVPWSIQHPFAFPSFGTSPINEESPSATASDSTNVKVPWSIQHPFTFPSFGTSPINEESPSETASDSTHVKVPLSIQHPITVPPFGASTINATPSTSTVGSLLAVADSSHTNNKAARKRQARKNRIPKCRVCFMSYGHVVYEMHSAMVTTKCGHLLCRPCVAQLLSDDKRDCPVCSVQNMVRYTKLKELFL